MNAGYIFFAILVTLVMPEVGGITWVQPVTLVGIFLVGVVLYVPIGAYRSRQGIDIGLTFKEIPPE